MGLLERYVVFNVNTARYWQNDEMQQRLEKIIGSIIDPKTINLKTEVEIQ